MTDLREKIVDVLDEWVKSVLDYSNYEGGIPNTICDIADRIRALLPKMPELRWDGRALRIGAIAVGRVGKEGDGRYYGNWLHDEDGYLTDEVNDDIFAPTEAEARATVEKAVRKLLGWDDAA